MRLYIGGASGCGKTTLAQACSQILRVPYFTGSAVMVKVAGVMTREELSELPGEILEDLRCCAFKNIYLKHSDMILEGHFFLTATDAEYLDQLLLLQPSPETIVAFRQSDSSRLRPLELESVVADVEATRRRAELVSEQFHLPLKVISGMEDVLGVTLDVSQLFHKQASSLLAPG